MKLQIIVFFLMLSISGNIFAWNDGFEGSQLASNWLNSGERKWQIASDQKTEGLNSIKATVSPIDQKSAVLETNVNLVSAGTISFSVRTRSVSSRNNFWFYIDNTRMIEVDEDTEWTRYSFPISAGRHSLRWHYWGETDFLGTAWIDDIRGPDSKQIVESVTSYSTDCKSVENNIFVKGFEGGDLTRNKNDIDFFVNGEKVNDFIFQPLGIGKRVLTSIAMDYSGSLTPEDKEFAENAAIEFVRDMDSNDLSEVIKFASDVVQTAPLVANKDVLAVGIRGNTINGTTTFYDALYQGIINLSRIQGERVILAYTDGVDFAGSTKSSSQVIAAANLHNVKIFTIGVGKFIDPIILQRFAKETGGIYFPSPNTQELISVYEKVRPIISPTYKIITDNPDAKKRGAVFSIRVAGENGRLSETVFEGGGCTPIMAPIYYLLDEN